MAAARASDARLTLFLGLWRATGAPCPDKEAFEDGARSRSSDLAAPNRAG